MPYKQRKYFTKKVVVKPKQHWSLYKRLGELTVKNPASGGVQYAYGTMTLVSANADTNYQPGLTKKIKHLKIEITRPRVTNLDKVAPTLMKSKLYIMYLPQGVNMNFNPASEEVSQSKYLSETIIAHPEWIMAERNLGTAILNDGKQTASTATLSCKLSRNLRSGDQVVAVVANLYDTAGFGSNAATTVEVPYKIEYSFAACI